VALMGHKGRARISGTPTALQSGLRVGDHHHTGGCYRACTPFTECREPTRTGGGGAVGQHRHHEGPRPPITTVLPVGLSIGGNPRRRPFYAKPVSVARRRVTASVGAQPRSVLSLPGRPARSRHYCRSLHAGDRIGATWGQDDAGHWAEAG
jgi:hypothetical protein